MNRHAPQWVQLLSDGLRVALVGGAIYFAATGEPRTGYGMALVAITAIALRFARAEPWVDFAFVALLSLDSWLTATGAMAQISKDDHAGHFILAAALVPMLAALIVRLFGEELARRPSALALRAAALAICAGVAWELVEYASDLWLGTDMSLGAAESALDLLADSLGAITGGVIAYLLWRSTEITSTIRSDRTSPID